MAIKLTAELCKISQTVWHQEKRKSLIVLPETRGKDSESVEIVSISINYLIEVSKSMVCNTWYIFVCFF